MIHADLENSQRQIPDFNHENKDHISRIDKMSHKVIEVATQAYQDQKPGTSGLRKKVKTFQQPNYTENFIQAILEATSKPKFLVVGGDGRFYSEEAIKKIISICAANGVERLVVARDGILSTPAVSNLIRSLKADGAMVLTASHNPGGENEDFGIKINTANGGPAPESVTDKIFELTKQIKYYKTLLKRPQIDLTKEQTFMVHNLVVEIVDPVEEYVNLLRQVFDFEAMKKFIKERDFKMLIDPMNGVVGPYAKRVLIEELGASAECLINSKPLPDFGGKHPDPNLTYAAELVDKLKAQKDIDFGVAFDGDGDRNMILGKEGFFVSPGDSLAIVADNIRCIKMFAEEGAKGFARSFPTSPAVDRVAEKAGLKCYVTPTGWKYFGALMDENLISLCGEESFGTGSDHIREKDGLWACMAWLAIIVGTDKTVKELVHDHWKTYGRDYFCRYDYEDCEVAPCQAMMKELERVLCETKSFIGKKFDKYEVKETGNFQYTDPITQKVTSKQGLYVMFTNGARIIVRLSGTGSSGATVRLYVSDYSKENILEDSQNYLKELLNIANTITRLPEYTGRDKPTVIT